MSYIGQGLPADVFSGFTTDSFTGDGSATTFTLSKAPFSEDGLIVVINNVIQKPTTNFTVSGTTLTIVGTAVADGDPLYAIHTSGAVPSTLASKVYLNGVSDTLILDADADTTISADTDDQIDFKAGGTDIMSLTATTATFNDGVEITTADNTDTLTLTSTDADANAGPNLRLYRNSGSPADNDLLGQIDFEGRNDNSQDVVYASILNFIDDASDGTEDSQFTIKTMKAGSLDDRLTIGSNITVFNDGSKDVDFRVESNNLTHALFVDAGNDIVRVGTSSGGDSANSVLQVGGGTDAVFPLHVFHTGNNSSAGPIGVQITYTASSPDSSVSPFLRCNDTTTARLLINSDGDVQNHDNSYGSTSDERIKSNIVDANSQWDDIKALKIRNYEKKDDIELYGVGKKVQIGVIAQELETAGMTGLTKDGEPDASDIKHGVPSDGKVKSVKYSVLYMKAIKALQEAMTRIETLEAEVTALKGE